MNQRIYFSGVGEVDLWSALSGRAYLDDAAHMLPFFSWDATPDLAQATWEWPGWFEGPTHDHRTLAGADRAWNFVLTRYA